MRVAARTPNRQSEPHCAGGLCAIEAGFHTKLFLIRAAFRIGQRLPVKGSGQPLHGSRIGQQVPCDLLNRELVEWHVAIDGVDDPVAPPPGVWSRPIFLVAIRVGIPGQVEPVSTPAFSEVRRLQ